MCVCVCVLIRVHHRLAVQIIRGGCYCSCLFRLAATLLISLLSWRRAKVMQQRPLKNRMPFYVTKWVRYEMQWHRSDDHHLLWHHNNSSPAPTFQLSCHLAHLFRPFAHFSSLIFISLCLYVSLWLIFIFLIWVCVCFYFIPLLLFVRIFRSLYEFAFCHYALLQFHDIFPT